MELIAGQVSAIVGYEAEDLLNDEKVSYVGLTVEEDRDRVFAEVNAAIENSAGWDISYRLVHKLGHQVWVRERGNAVKSNGEITHLQGLIVGARAEFELHEKMMNSLEQTTKTSAEIGKLTKNITSSVRELSMLSINASIEAARSGEAGKGFAVVANEMRALATKNAESAELITTSVNSLQADIQQ
ncbi:MAG: methyl-accepting chemotaxis protein [Sulfitobacter sp.]